MDKPGVSRCEGCPFKTKLCGTRGPEDSPFVIVGESPGTHELRVGKPFVGPSGKLLARVLKEAGFDSLDIEPYIINAMSCLPAEKNMQNLERATRACNVRVQEQIKAHPRKVILALGVAASWATTQNYSIRILKDRGRVVPSSLASNGIVLTVHPAYLMRNGSALSVWKKDIKQAVKLLRGNKLEKWAEPTWAVHDTPSAVNEIVEEYVAEGGVVTGDVETTDLHWMRGEMLCHGFTKGDGSHVDIIPEKMLYAMKRPLKRLMEAPNIRWNWANGLFDIKWFRYLWGINARVDEDIMLLSYTMNENRGYHDVDQIAQHWIGAPRHKDAMDHYYKEPPFYSLRNAPEDVLFKYNARDISKSHCAFFPMREAIREDWNAINEYRSILIPAVEFLAAMQLYGVEADIDKIKSNIAEHEKELEEIRAKINVYAQKHLGHDLNPNSPKQVKELIYGKMKLGHITMATDENALIEAKRKHEHPIIDLILDHREVAKRKGTYVTNILRDDERKNRKKRPGFIQDNGRVHADYKLHGTATGRLAGSDPNMLNQPRGPLIRSQYKAGKGKIFCEVDLNQAELRSLALMSGDPILMDIYTKNEVSIHDVTTGSFFAPKSDVIASNHIAEQVAGQLSKHYENFESNAAVYAEAKMRGKAVNFGIVYGREAFSLAREFNIPIAEAQRWIDEWLGLYEGAAAFIDWCRRAPTENRTLITVYGRKKRPGAVGRETLRNLQNEFANFPHQSTASDIMLETAIEVAPVLRSKWNAYIWNELYDAIYFECEASDDILQQAVPYIQGVITEIPRHRGLLRVPFLGDAKIGYTWGSMKDYDPTKDTIQSLLGERHEREVVCS
jgi:uracil-DNA glycosylase family 4